MTTDPAIPSSAPSTPPQTVSKDDSTRNCAATSRREAPTARRMPTSRVRSATLASMMFMIPIPPTSRLMAAMAPVTTLKMRCVRSFWRRISRGTTTSTGAPPVVRCTTRRATSAAGRDLGRVVHPQDDLVDAVRPRVAAAVQGGQGDEDRAVDVARADGAGPVALGGAALDDTHHLEPVAAHLDPLAARGRRAGNRRVATEAPSTATRLRSWTSRSVTKRPAEIRSRAAAA